MKLINGDRCSGKTTTLIKYAYENNALILCCSCGNLNYIIEKAKELKLDIIIPRVFKTYIESNHKIEYMKTINGNIINDTSNIRLVIDEIDCCLESIIREGIDCVTGTIQIENLNNHI
ncbi:hypothetical protein Q3390_13575 [Clostridioides difficile]|nr:hypothetical protein [Clostridioides difficile]MCI4246506.1 hypothetical protein [Clostridioides difficile]MCL6805307.1 hypothetical protein [Clostridioides difficile]MDS6292582.1 hypothetical protein [Clostridioides difficile]HBF2882042.1 hypothetical protein [Clostridioides difficile]